MASKLVTATPATIRPLRASRMLIHTITTSAIVVFLHVRPNLTKPLARLILQSSLPGACLEKETSYMFWAKCEMCTSCEPGVKVEAFCRQCSMFICAECVNQHQRLRVFAGHKISALDRLMREGRTREFVREPILQQCDQHDQPMNIYCYDCGCLICCDCTYVTIRDHHSHNHEFIKKAARQVGTDNSPL